MIERDLASPCLTVTVPPSHQRSCKASILPFQLAIDGTAYIYGPTGKFMESGNPQDLKENKIEHVTIPSV